MEATGYEHRSQIKVRTGVLWQCQGSNATLVAVFDIFNIFSTTLSKPQYQFILLGLSISFFPVSLRQILPCVIAVQPELLSPNYIC